MVIPTRHHDDRTEAVVALAQELADAGVRGAKTWARELRRMVRHFQRAPELGPLTNPDGTPNFLALQDVAAVVSSTLPPLPAGFLGGEGQR